MLPQSNATLTQVLAPGFSEDDDYAGVDGDLKWSGSEDAYVDDVIRTQFAQTAGILNKARDTRIILSAELPVTIDIGDVLLYTFRGQPLKRKVTDFDSRELVGIPHPTMRYHLEEVEA